MLRLDAVRLDPQGDPLRYAALLKHVPPEKREKLERFRNRMDAMRSLTGELVSRIHISEATGIPVSEIVFGTTAYGKPYVPQAEGFHFNVSHAGDWVVCVSGGEPLGVDVERMDTYNASVPEFIMSAEELELWSRTPEEERPAMFYGLWTGKEGFVKAIGTGLYTEPRTITISNPFGESSIYMDGVLQACRIYRWRLTPEYPLAVCCAEAVPQQETLQISAAGEWFDRFEPV